jgi:transglutaminase-like putative cysteine protease
VKNVQVILKDSFRFAEREITDESGQVHLIKYFNGVTLDDAIESNAEIDAEAQAIVGTETDARQQAYLIYLWICENIKYDTDKAAALSVDSAKVPSGAAIAYATRTGVCFDYACLYIAMCRAVDVKIRFLTGLGYTGSNWGDHAWNQVYAENGWINVDTTFGSSGINYFDRPHFNLDHKDAVVQGEWDS